MWNHNRIVTRAAIKLCIALVGWALAGAVHAQAVCDYASDNPYGAAPLRTNISLNISALTIGRDVPDGTELYRQTVNPQQMAVRCAPAVSTITRTWTLPTTPRLSSWNSGRYAGKTYETGVPGIGVAIWKASDVFPFSQSSPNCGGGTAYCIFNFSPIFDITIIKIGPVSPGVIQGVNLPTAALDVTPGGVAMMRITFSGSIQIVAQTCTTPDVTVPLGEHLVREFTGQNSATSWRDFSIRLQNCPAFYGATSYLRVDDSATGFKESNRSLTANTLGFSLAPTTAILDAARGIVALSPTSSGPAAATGVGVQVANTSNTPVLYNTVMPSGITPTAVDGASYSIPLRARYIQTGSAAPTPGPANTSMMFTINYQ